MRLSFQCTIGLHVKDKAHALSISVGNGRFCYVLHKMGQFGPIKWSV